MNRDEYNRNVQNMQRMFTDTNVRPHYASGQNSAFPAGELIGASFEVYWDGKWHEVGYERFPLTDRVERSWNEELANRLRYQFADSLVRS